MSDTYRGIPLWLLSDEFLSLIWKDKKEFLKFGNAKSKKRNLVFSKIPIAKDDVDIDKISYLASFLVKKKKRFLNVFIRYKNKELNTYLYNKLPRITGYVKCFDDVNQRLFWSKMKNYWKNTAKYEKKLAI